MVVFEAFVWVISSSDLTSAGGIQHSPSMENCWATQV